MELITRSAAGPGLTTGAEHLDGRSTLIMIFASRSVLETSTIVADVHAAFPTSVIVGCSSAGHFVGELLEDDHAVLVASRFEHTQLRVACAPLAAPEESRAVGEKLAIELTGPDLKAVVVLSDGITCNGSALVDGLVDNLDDNVVVFGGLAADDDAFVQTLTIGRGTVAAGQVVAVGLSGDRLVVRTGSRGGWDLFGPERTITSSLNSVLFELDHEPAIDLYRRYLGDRAEELPGSALLFPLAIRQPDADFDHRVVRTVLGIDETNKTMTFAGDMPAGWRAQLMRASFDSLIDGAADAAERVAGPSGIVGHALCFGVSCVGRRLVLGSRVEDELEAVTNLVDDATTLAGFYAYGELAPGNAGGCELHNQTMTLTLLGER